MDLKYIINRRLKEDFQYETKDVTCISELDNIIAECKSFEEKYFSQTKDIKSPFTNENIESREDVISIITKRIPPRMSKICFSTFCYSIVLLHINKFSNYDVDYIIDKMNNYYEHVIT